MISSPPSLLRTALRPCCALLVLSAVLATSAAAQGAPASATSGTSPGATLSDADIKSFAALHVAIAGVRDTIDAQLAEARNKTPQAQQSLREKLRTQVAALVSKSGLSDSEYQRRRYVVSSDGRVRAKFDSVIAVLTGAPLPGQAPAAAPSAPANAAPAPVAVPAGPAGTHLGHVLNAFGDTPGGVGLLTIAEAEARIAAQHAALAARNTSDLAAMQLHAGHVIHALDPTAGVATGPGRGYGVKRAATGVAAHTELAAKADMAPASVTTHAPHIATAARATVARADQIIALAKQLQAATAAPAAASLLNQIVSLTNQLVAGVDANSDGRITWDAAEGGLQQAREHLGFAVRP